MQIDVTTQEPPQARITLDARELYLLKVCLERACYIDTDPKDQADANQFAEVFLAALRGAGPGASE